MNTTSYKEFKETGIVKPLVFTTEELVDMAIRSESEDIMSKVCMMIERDSRWVGLAEEDKKQLDRLDEAILELRRKSRISSQLEDQYLFLKLNVDNLEKRVKEELAKLNK